MAIKISLENVERKRETIMFPAEIARRLVQQNRRDELWETFKSALDENPLHESLFVFQIVNWVPDPTKPPPPIELMQWASLLTEAGKLDGESKEWILDVDEQKLVWERITDKKFSFSGSPVDFMPFYMKLHKALASTFEGKKKKE